MAGYLNLVIVLSGLMQVLSIQEHESWVVRRLFIASNWSPYLLVAIIVHESD